MDFWLSAQILRTSKTTKANRNFLLFAPPARRKSKENKGHAEMPKVWPAHDEV